MAYTYASDELDIAKTFTVFQHQPRVQAMGTVFPGAACVAALVDRFNQHCHKPLITADSWRETHPFDHDPEKPTDPKRPRKRR